MNIAALKIDGEFPTNFLPLELSNCRSFEDYCEIGSMIQATVLNHQWWVGDWLIYGEDYFPDIYTQAIELTGNSLQNLMNYRRVAGAFPPERRVPELSFSAHRELAPLSEEEQDAIIGLALNHGVTDSRGISKLKKDLKKELRVAVEDKEDNGYCTGDVVLVDPDEVVHLTPKGEMQDYQNEPEEPPVPKGKMLSKSEQVWMTRLLKDGTGTLEKARVGVGFLQSHINPEDIAALDRVIAQLKEIKAWYMD